MGFGNWGIVQTANPPEPVTMVGVIGSMEKRLRQHDRALGGKNEPLTGQRIYTTSSVQSFTLADGDVDGFTVTLPGAGTVTYEVKVTGRAQLPASSSLLLKVGGTTTYVSSLADLEVGTAVMRVLNGGDTFTCEIAWSGTGDPQDLTIDYAALRLGG